MNRATTFLLNHFRTLQLMLRLAKTQPCASAQQPQLTSYACNTSKGVSL